MIILCREIVLKTKKLRLKIYCHLKRVGKTCKCNYIINLLNNKVKYFRTFTRPKCNAKLCFTENDLLSNAK